MTSSLTHQGPDHLSKNEIAQEYQSIEEKLKNDFKDQPSLLAESLHALQAFSEFGLGRFLIKHQALSGYWTWYIINKGHLASDLSSFEQFLLEKTPISCAMRDRFAQFQTLLSRYIQSNQVIASLPCGMMTDLLTLRLSKNIDNLRFVGIDLDAAVFDLAKELAQKEGVKTPCDFIQKEAWQLDLHKQFDILITNGLNLYEKDDSKVVELYRRMRKALKDQGLLICSALTPPPTETQTCEWNMAEIDQVALAKTAGIFKMILKPAWSHYRSSTKTCEQLQEAGFSAIEIYWDRQKMFPTFVAR